MTAADPAELVVLAERIAREAGTLVRERRAAVERMTVAATKSTPTDVVTESDTAAEELIRTRLADARPDDGILGEEAGTTAGGSGVLWVVDPIDGTVNYLYGIPQYAVSIAAQVDGVVVAGVVHNPESGATWTARRGGGAHLDRKPIRQSGCDRLDRALVGTGFGYDAARRAGQAAVLLEVLPAVRDIRRAGAAALDLCAVATGWLDAFYERGLAAWDLAAGALIAEEAGAVVGGLHGRGAGPDLVLAAAPGIAAELRDLLERVGADRDPD
ncbi:MAG TPA: inositol monophosphatase family protein [Jiangellaceae bacterium]|nr:inositol monophosphatase family protein [Jiangellaceae bacterium]